MTPESFTTTRHRCPHCRRSWSKLAAAQAHLDRGCRKDPNAHACATCAHEYIGQPASKIKRALVWHLNGVNVEVVK